MTKLQRRLIVGSIVIVLFLGPIAIMGNCSGWNEGSMKVAACTLDSRLLRDLADLLYGVVLISAFILGLPILLYIAIGVAVTMAVNRTLRKRFPAGSPAMRLGGFVALIALPAAIVAMLAFEVGGAASSWNARNRRFDDRCRAAVERVVRVPSEPVDGLYYDGDIAGGEPGDLIDRGWLRFAEAPDSPGRPGAAADAKYRRYALNEPYPGKPAKELTSAYGVFSRKLTSREDQQAGIQGEEIAVKALGTGETIATTTYFSSVALSKFCSAGETRPSDSFVNGVASSFDLGPFLIRALALKQQAGTSLDSEMKGARKRDRGTVVRVSPYEWTLLGETEDALIYIDATRLPMDSNQRTVWAMENFKTRGNSGVASVRSHVEYDCKKRTFRSLEESPLSEPMGGGDLIRLKKPSGQWRAVSPNSVGDLILGTVCAR